MKAEEKGVPSERRVVLVTRKTRMEELIERFNTWSQAKFYLEHNRVDASDYLREHEVYQFNIKAVEQLLHNQVLFQQLERSYLPNYLFSEDDLVVVVGQDGLVANTLKYLDRQPLIAINPDPDRWDGQLLPFTIEDLPAVIDQIWSGEYESRPITFAQAKCNDGQQLLAVNDLFIGPISHTSARYHIQWMGEEEDQSSSGIIVSTGLGSSGWLRSIIAGAMGVSMDQYHPLEQGFDWGEERLQFTVREPFPRSLSGLVHR